MADKQNSYNGCTFKPRLRPHVMFSEAEKGYGGFITSRLNVVICCVKFNQNDKQAMSTKYVFPNFGHILKNQSIQVNTDKVVSVEF